MSIARYKLIRKKPLTVRRTVPGQYVNGRWIEGEASTFEILGHYYPLSAQEKLTLPESFRSKSMFKMHSISELYSVREAQAQSADSVFLNGYWYEVQQADLYSMGVRDHYEYLLIREEQSAGGTH